MRLPFCGLFFSLLLLAACGSDSNSTSDSTDNNVTDTTANTAHQCAANYSEDNPPPIEHVFIIVLENKSFDETYGPGSPAPFLREQLVPAGQLLSHFYGTSHASTGNYISMIGGQAPNPASHGDCAVFNQWTSFGDVLEYGQANGTGCVYPENFPTIVDELDASNSLLGTQYTWRGWMEDMALEQQGDVRAQGRPSDNTCVNPALNTLDATNGADSEEQYAARHNPFVFFRSIVGDAATAEDFARCDANVIDLHQGSPSQGLPGLKQALQSRETTPNFNYIVPDNCHNAHDTAQQCKDSSGGPGGLAEADQFLADWVPAIMASDAYREAGMILIIFDEANYGQGGMEDYEACCGMELDGGLRHRGADPGLNGLLGPGGGRFGAVVLSPFTQAGTLNDTKYNHYSLLRSLENLFGLDQIHIDPAQPDSDPLQPGYIGYAGLPADEGMHAFGSDVYNCLAND